MQAKPGIVYLSNIPPGMKPISVRQILGQYGDIGRVYLQAEDDENFRERKRKKGYASHLYTEGWVEFKDRRVARFVAKSLNNNDMGRKKRDKYAGYLWNIKYLRGFTWTQIHQQLAEEQEETLQRKTIGISQANKEVKFLMKNFKRSKINEKRKKTTPSDKVDNEIDDVKETFDMKFTQKPVTRQNTTTNTNSASSVLKQLFG